MKLWSVILATLLIFGMGFVAGAVLGKKKAEPRQWSRSKSGDSSHSRFRRDQQRRMEFIARCNRELGLSEEQSKQIGTIISESQTRTKAIWEEFAPRMKEEMEATQARIKELLNPDQQARFEEIMKRSWGSRRKSGGPSGQSDDKPPPPANEPSADSPPPPEGADAGASSHWSSAVSICASAGRCQ